MAKQKFTMEVIPSARRLIQSLRDLGYDFKQAVADVIDNSIAADATLVAIDMRFDGSESWVRVADDGCGMSGALITEAMRFGTERDYEADELGKFGLGLKTASLSQCSRVTVASRTDRSIRRMEVRQWDLEHVQTTNRWEIIAVPAGERRKELVAPLRDNRGTVVLWEMLDRVMGYKIPWGDRAKNGFFRLAEELDLHLGMVFHRFLSGHARRKKPLRITINGTTVESWDPFARDETATVRVQPMECEVIGNGGPGIVLCAPFILPPKERFSSLKAFERHAGPGKWNYQQGFYIYRADRMIQSGGWSYMRTSDEHTKLARIALEFWPDLDSAFDVNVAKARVNLPIDLRTKLKPLVDQVAKQARKAYTPSMSSADDVSGNKVTQGKGSIGSEKGGKKITVASGDSVADEARTNNPEARVTDTPQMQGGEDEYRTKTAIGKALERAAAEADETAALNRIRKVLRVNDPDTAIEIGW